MECSALHQMIEEDWKRQRLQVGTIVSDDDTTMKKILRHNYDELVKCGDMKREDWPKNDQGEFLTSGNLSNNIPEPKFLADFNHRVKSVGKVVWDLARKPKKDSLVDKSVAMRLKLYWSKMLNQIQDLDIKNDWKKVKDSVSAPIEHIFDNHQHCNIDWCYSLKATKEGKQYTPSVQRPFYDKTGKYKSMYEQLISGLERFQTKRSIEECLHPFDTQKNESINQQIARFVPKFKHFGTTTALDTRVATVVGIVNYGYEKFYNELIDQIGIFNKTNRPFISIGISQLNQCKLNNQQLKKKQEYMRQRSHGKDAKQRQEVYEERIDEIENLGTYGTAVCFETNESNKQKQTTTKTNECSYCKTIATHKTWRSKHCPGHKLYLQHKEQQDKVKARKRKDKRNIDNSNKSNKNSYQVVGDKNEKKREVSDVMESGGGLEMVTALSTDNASEAKQAIVNNIVEKNNENEEIVCLTSKKHVKKKVSEKRIESTGNTYDQMVQVEHEEKTIPTELDTSTYGKLGVQQTIFDNGDIQSVHTGNVLANTKSCSKISENTKKIDQDSNVDLEANVQVYVENIENMDIFKKLDENEFDTDSNVSKIDSCNEVEEGLSYSSTSSLI